MMRLLPILMLLILLVACAKARETGGNGNNVRMDGALPDRPKTPPLKKDKGVQPKKDKGRKDAPVSDTKPWPKDIPPPPDKSVPKPDLPTPKPCPDAFEKNNTCLANRSVGSTTEGSTWIKKSATLSPPGDVDWFSAQGKEASHSCLPFTSQTYYFSFRVDVPAGRQVKACVVKRSCSGTDTCQTVTGPAQINVKYKVSGTCAFTDDTSARLMVHALDSKHDCTPYSLSFNYK